MAARSVTTVGLRDPRLVSSATEAVPTAALVIRGPATVRRQALDDQLDQQMTRLLREAAEVRDERERARSSEDALLAQREATALLDVLRTRGRPKAKYHLSRPGSRHSPRPTLVMP